MEKVNPGGSSRRSGGTSLLQYGWHGGQAGSADTVGAYCWTEQRLTDSSSWSTRCMISYRVLPICSPGAWWTHLLANSQRRGGLLELILSCCPKAMGEGRYRCCHNQVLRVVADTICTSITSSKWQHQIKCPVSFVCFWGEASTLTEGQGTAG